MPNVKMVIAYDGTDFHGFARQKDLRTVQGILETVLGTITGEAVEVFGSGRTDAGVHARAQVVHFRQEHGPPPSRYPYIMRRALPADIVAISTEVVPDEFHARFSATSKTYRYTIDRSRVPDVFTRRYVWHVPTDLDLARMQEAGKVLVGEHDFTSFCAASTPIENKVRTIREIRFVERGPYLDVYCTGSGFLQNMVRIIVGTLVDVAESRLSLDRVAYALEAKDRRLAGRTAPASGLTLWEVHYSNSYVT